MKRILFVLVLVTAILASTSIASAKTTRIEFTGSEWCDEDTLIFEREKLAGPNMQIKHITQVCYDTASIPQLSGTDYLTDGDMHVVGQNFIIDGNLRMESDEGGVWVGSWVLPAHTNTIKVIAHGEGLYEGMILHWYLSLDGPFWGYIFTPGK